MEQHAQKAPRGGQVAHPNGFYTVEIMRMLCNFFLHTWANWCIILASQIINSGRIANGPAQKRIYTDRAAGGYRNHCFIDVDINAGLAKGQEAGTGHDLPEQSQTNRHGGRTLRRR